jgi:hypothetical protein
MLVKEEPTTALDMACRIAHVVNTLVGRPIHVVIVNGLKRKLGRTISTRLLEKKGKTRSYKAAIARLLHLLSFLGEVNSFEEPASPVSAIAINAFALRRSVIMYKKYVNMGYVEKSGRRENSGRSRGAWW